MDINTCNMPMVILEDIILSINNSDVCDSSALVSISDKIIAIVNKGIRLPSGYVHLLKKKVRSTEENHRLKKLLVWCHLLETLENVSDCNLLIYPLLKFCLATCRESKSGKAKKREKNIFKRLVIEVIFQILETKKNVHNKELENYKWTLNSFRAELLLDSPDVKAILVDIFAELLNSLKKDFDFPATILFKISLKLSQRIKGSDKQLYITFLKCLQSLLEKKILEEEKLVELTVSSSFILVEVFSSPSAASHQMNEGLKMQFDAVNILLDINSKLFLQIKLYKNLSRFLQNLASSLLDLLRTPVGLESVIPSFTSQLARLWQIFCQCVVKMHGLSCTLHDLEILLPLMECALLHPHRNIKKSAQRLWTSTFIHLSDQSHPESPKSTVPENAANKSAITICVDGQNSKDTNIQNQTMTLPCTSPSKSNSEKTQFLIDDCLRDALSRMDSEVEVLKFDIAHNELADSKNWIHKLEYCKDEPNEMYNNVASCFYLSYLDELLEMEWDSVSPYHLFSIQKKVLSLLNKVTAKIDHIKMCHVEDTYQK